MTTIQGLAADLAAEPGTLPGDQGTDWMSESPPAKLGGSASLIIGSVPAVFVGSLVSSSAPDRYIRPVITFVIAASGLKYVGLDTTALGWVLCGALFAAGAIWLAYLRPRARTRAMDEVGVEPREAGAEP
jgi:hypothetical protein